MDYTKSRQQRQYFIYAAVAQLDRVPDSDSGGRGFESRQPYQTHIIRTEFSEREICSDFVFSMGIRTIEMGKDIGQVKVE